MSPHSIKTHSFPYDFHSSNHKDKKNCQKVKLNAFPSQGFSFFIHKYITIVLGTTEI